MRKNKSKKELANSRQFHIRINGKENCLIWDNFISDIKVNNVGKKSSEKKIINQIFSELIIDFVRNKKINNYKLEISTVIQPYINKAIEKALRLPLLALVKNQNDLLKQMNQLASLSSLIARIVSKIQKPDGTDLVQSDKVESGETTAKSILSWMTAFNLKNNEGEEI